MPHQSWQNGSRQIGTRSTNLKHCKWLKAWLMSNVYYILCLPPHSHTCRYEWLDPSIKKVCCFQCDHTLWYTMVVWYWFTSSMSFPFLLLFSFSSFFYSPFPSLPSDFLLPCPSHCLSLFPPHSSSSSSISPSSYTCFLLYRQSGVVKRRKSCYTSLSWCPANGGPLRPS